MLACPAPFRFAVPNEPDLLHRVHRMSLGKFRRRDGRSLSNGVAFPCEEFSLAPPSGSVYHIRTSPRFVQRVQGAMKKATVKKKAAKKKSAKKKAAKSAAPLSGNLGALTKAGVIPAGYSRLSPAEKKAIESLSAAEVDAIVAAKTKMGRKFFSKHAAHGMLY
jgi:hypothetical protein